MSERPLEIEWPNQPLEIEEATNNALVVRDPLGALSSIFGYQPLSEEARKRYATRSVNAFWQFVQEIMENEFNIQLSKILLANASIPRCECPLNALYATSNNAHDS